jgi:predicted nucleic acid-binding protein
MSFVVVYDASVLFPTTLRDLLLRVAQSSLVQAKWTEEILDEMFAALRRQRPDLDFGRLSRTRALMATAVRDWKITGYESLTESIKLPDANDRHVLAAAIRAHAQLIVTSNLRDFPAEELRPFRHRTQVPGRVHP